MLPTFQTWTVRKMIECLTQGLLSSHSNIYHSTTAYFFEPPCRRWILPLIAGLAAKALPILTSTILPALATGALGGLASTGVNKLLGSGLYLKTRRKRFQDDTSRSGSISKTISQYEIE